MLDLNNPEILNLPHPPRQLKERILAAAMAERQRELPTQLIDFILDYPFASVQELVEKLTLWAHGNSEQLTAELLADIFDPFRSNVVIPRYASRVSCGFLSSAEDYREGVLSLNQKFIKNPSATFPVQAQGECMRETIQDGDILLVDQSLAAKSSDIVLAVLNGEFTVKRLLINAGNYQLRPDNPVFPTIIITEGMQLEIRGVVTSVHRHLRVN